MSLRPTLHLLFAALAFNAYSATTQPSAITLHVQNQSALKTLEALSRQAGAPLPLLAQDAALDKTISLDIDKQPFWTALEAFSKQSGLQPVIPADDTYPRLQLGLGSGEFWEEPHVVSGPLLVFVNDIVRTNTIELGKTKHEHDQELAVNLTCFTEPGLRVLWASGEVKLLSAKDDKGHLVTGASTPVDVPLDNTGVTPNTSTYTWPMTIALSGETEISSKIASLKAQTQVRIQTASEKLEFDDIFKARNVTKSAKGISLTLKSIKKNDIEYLVQLSLPRDKRPDRDWQNLVQSIYNGQMTLYDAKGRVVCSRGTENGGDYAGNKIEAILRFVREPGLSDPQAGEPTKLIWQAPTESRDLTVEFELKDLPVPQ